MADDIQSKAGDFMKRMLTVGVGTLFLTEESLRGLVSDFKLPKELLGTILESANKTRKEFLQNLSGDLMTRLSEKVDPKALIQEVLSKNDIHLSIKMSFTPKKDASESETQDS